MTTFYDLERFGGRTALTADDLTTVSYRALAALADRTVRLIPVGSLMLLFADNSVESLAAYLGALRRRVVVAPVRNNLAADAVETLENAYRPEYLFLPNARTDLARDGDETLETIGDFALIRRRGREKNAPNAELAVLLSTSGSTGSPKTVRLSRRNLTSNAESIVEALKMNPDDRAITTLPAYYSYGLSILHSHLAIGASVVLTDAALTQKAFWDLFAATRPTHFGGVPYTYEILRRLRFGRIDTPSLRSVSQAGGRMSPERVAEFRDICRQKGIQLYIMYGQTEATARIAVLPPELLDSKPESVGRPIPGGKIELQDENGAKTEKIGDSGEIIYSGPNVALGYAENRADLARGDDFSGILPTGDLARRDSDGCYTILGRKSRFLKIFGNRVSLDESERLLAERGIEAACVGTDEKMKIFVTVADRESFVVEYLAERTGLNRSAFEAIFIPELPRTESGKIRYGALEATR